MKEESQATGHFPEIVSELTIGMPCLNEAETVETCVDGLRRKDLFLGTLNLALRSASMIICAGGEPETGRGRALNLKMQILILGMHWSGTSMVVRLLNMIGVYFAPEGTSTGSNENPKGFWERRHVRALNAKLPEAIRR